MNYESIRKRSKNSIGEAEELKRSEERERERYEIWQEPRKDNLPREHSSNLHMPTQLLGHKT